MTSPFDNKYIRLLLLIALVLGLALLWLLREPWAEVLTFVADREAFSKYIHGFGMASPIVLGAMHALQMIISLLPGDLFFLAAGYLYGFSWGFVFNLLVTFVMSLVAFSIARKWGRPVVDRLAPARVVDRWDAVSERHGFPFFLMSYMLPVFPTDTMNYIAGLSSISLRDFAIACLIGRTPLIALMTFLGANGLEYLEDGFPDGFGFMIGVAVVLLYVVWLVFFRNMALDVLAALRAPDSGNRSKNTN